MNAIMGISFLFLIVIVFVGVFFSKSFNSKLNRMLSWKSNLLLALVYLLLLVFLVPVSALLNDTLFQSGDKRLQITDSTIIDREEEKFSFQPGKSLAEYPEKYKNGSWTFPITVNTLKLTASADWNYWVQVERKDTNDGKVEVSSYVTPHYTDIVNFTQVVEPPQISLTNDVLAVKAKEQRFNFSVWTSNFTIQQFNPRDPGWYRPMTYAALGGQAILLRVPKDLEIIRDEFNIDFIN